MENKYKSSTIDGSVIYILRNGLPGAERLVWLFLMAFDDAGAWIDSYGSCYRWLFAMASCGAVNDGYMNWWCLRNSNACLGMAEVMIGMAVCGTLNGGSVANIFEVR